MPSPRRMSHWLLRDAVAAHEFSKDVCPMAVRRRINARPRIPGSSASLLGADQKTRHPRARPTPATQGHRIWSPPGRVHPGDVKRIRRFTRVHVDAGLRLMPIRNCERIVSPVWWAGERGQLARWRCVPRDAAADMVGRQGIASRCSAGECRSAPGAGRGVVHTTEEPAEISRVGHADPAAILRLEDRCRPASYALRPSGVR